MCIFLTNQLSELFNDSPIKTVAMSENCIISKLILIFNKKLLILYIYIYIYIYSILFYIVYCECVQYECNLDVGYYIHHIVIVM